MKFRTDTTNSIERLRLDQLSHYTVTRLEDGKVYRTNRRPRKDSKVWGFQFLVWDNERNEQAAR